jgi:hypothetical protein
MKQRAFLSCLIPVFILTLILSGCAGTSSAYDAPVVENTATFVEAPPMTWDIQRLDAPPYYKYLGRGYLRLRAPGQPCVAYGNDHLYYSCYDGTAWSMETVDADFGVGIFATLALDTAGRAHIAYYDQIKGRLKYAVQGEDGWTIQVVSEADTNTDPTLPYYGNGGTPSIVLDADQQPLIAFYDYDLQALKFASLQDGQWVVEIVDDSPGAGADSSLALDAQGQPHVAYFDQGAEVLKYAMRIANQWQIKVVDDDGRVGQYASLALDSAGNPHIAYYDIENTHLKYAVWDADQMAFQTSTLTDLENTGEFASLALDSKDQAHIAYYRRVDGSEVYYLRQQNGEWVKEKVSVGERDLVGLFATIALDSQDRPYFAYRHASDNQLKVAFRSDDGQYTNQVVFQSTRLGEMTSLAVDSKDRVHIVYENDSQDSLRYALWDGSDWRLSIVEEAIDTGVHPSLKLTRDDRPRATFWGLPSVKFAQQLDDGQWQVNWIEVHEYGDWTGWYTSLALGKNEQPHASYYDWLDYDLKYAVFKGGKWVNEVVDSEGDVGGYTSLVLVDDGRPLIAYYDFTNQDLKLAWKAGGRWQTRVLDHVGEVELYPSLARTENGQVYLSYIADDGASLKVAHLDGTQWTIETIDQGGHYFKSTSLVLDKDGRPHVAFYDGKHKALRYAWQTGGGWAVTTVNPDGNYGMGASLGLDSQGRAHISFQDVINQDLMYATVEE